MESKHQLSEKRSHRILILIVIGLLALSSAAKELNQLRLFVHDASQVLATITEVVVPTANNNKPVIAGSCSLSNDFSLVSADAHLY